MSQRTGGRWPCFPLGCLELAEENFQDTLSPHLCVVCLREL